MPPRERAPSVVAVLSQVASVVAPTTVITALLVYYGFIVTRARLDYFGVYLELTGLSNQDLVLSSLEALYVPAVLAALALLAGALVHGGVTWFLTGPRRDLGGLILAAVITLVALLVLGRAVLGLLIRRIAAAETPGTSALALAIGPALLLYGLRVAAKVQLRARHRRFDEWYGSRPARTIRRTATVAVVCVALGGLLWATTSFAWAVGQSRGYDYAVKLPQRPAVVLFTEQPLPEVPDNVSSAPVAGDGFHYRYDGLRLLLAADNRLFLVPAYWTEHSRTLVIPYDEHIRIDLVPQ